MRFRCIMDTGVFCRNFKMRFSSFEEYEGIDDLQMFQVIKPHNNIIK